MSKNRLTRREERETVFKLLFSASFRTEETPAQILEEYEEDNEIVCSDYVRSTFLGASAYLKEADGLIEADSKNWKASRLSLVTSALLHLSVYEMLETDVPPKVAINEAVELAKIYDDAAAAPFINGILNRIGREAGVLAGMPVQRPEEK